MPFAYYGAKHGLARKYPSPIFGTIVEPFAGSAGYSVRHAASVGRVVLVDADPAVVALWHRLKGMTVTDLHDIDRHVAEDERTTDPLIASIGGSTGLKGTLRGQSRQITPRMRSVWPLIRRRIAATLPHLHKFEIIHGTYIDAPDIPATWHIDPPYQPCNLNPTRRAEDQAGNGYHVGADGIDYQQLAEWCRTRQGLVMVCEQSPAEWLPFSPLARQSNTAQVNVSTRTEMIWRNDSEQGRLFGSST